MFCKWCGNTIKTTDKKCSSCGRETPPLSDCGGFYDLKRPWEAPVPPPEPAHTYMSAPSGPDPRVQQLEEQNRQIREDANRRHLILLIICGVLALLLIASVIFHFVGDDEPAAPGVPPVGNGSQVEPTGNGESEPTGTADPTDETTVATEPEPTHTELDIAIIDEGKELFVGEGCKLQILESSDTALTAEISWEVTQKAREDEVVADATENAAEVTQDTAQENTAVATEKVTLTADWAEGLRVSCDASQLSVFAPEKAEQENTQPGENAGPEEKKTAPTCSYQWQRLNEKGEWMTFAIQDKLGQDQFDTLNLKDTAEMRCIITVENGEEAVLELVLSGFCLTINPEDPEKPVYSVTFPKTAEDFSEVQEPQHVEDEPSELENQKED